MTGYHVSRVSMDAVFLTQLDTTISLLSLRVINMQEDGDKGDA